MKTPLKNSKTLTFIALFFCLTLLASSAHATLVVPKRVMIDSGRRAGGLTIYNQNTEPMAYTFEWERRAQLPNGDNIVLKEGETLDGYRPADDMFMFSPRRVIINPGEFQRVRILARRPANLADGEYHSHIKIMPEPLAEKQGNVEIEKGFGGVFNIKTHMSVPVFLRQGKTVLDFDLKNINMTRKDGQDAISFTVENHSSRSVYAKHVVTCTTADGDIKTEIGVTRLYVEAKAIAEEFPLGAKPPPLSSCSAITLNVYGLQDFEYKANEPIRTYKLK